MGHLACFSSNQLACERARGNAVNFEVYEGPEPFESFLPVGVREAAVQTLSLKFETFALVVEVTLPPHPDRKPLRANL